MNRLFQSGSVLAVILGAGVGSAHAQAQGTQVEEVIVTATKTGATRLQDTPIAITAFTTATIDRAAISDIRDLASITPNLAIAENTGLSEVYIRGIGSNNVFPGSDPSSTVHLDGVYLARPSSYFSNFLDVERVEVLRGPQGTLYGRNSVGGTINIISRKPTDAFQAKAQATAGNYNLYRGEGYISGPLLPGAIDGSLSLLRSKRDGYQKNIAPGGNPAVDSEDVWSTRGQLRFRPNDRLDVTARADYMKADEVPGGYLKPLVASSDPLANSILGDYRRVAINTPQNTKTEDWGVSLDASEKINDALTLMSLTSYRHDDFSFALDSDARAALIRRTDFIQAQNQFSQEFNLTGHYDKLTFVGGAYYFHENIAADLRVSNYPSTQVNPNVTVHTRALAGYFQGTYEFSERFSATAGIRYTDERKLFGQVYNIRDLATLIPNPTYPHVSSPTGNYHAWTPKLEIDFKPAKGVLVYGSVTRGFKSGGFNITSANPRSGFQPEFLWSYEAGFKGDLLDRRLRLNAAAFHYDYSDLQVQSFITPGVTDISNAATATVNGVEVETVARPSAGLELGASVSYLDATYKQYPGAPFGATTIDASGNRLNSAPRWSYSAYGQYEFELAGGSVTLRGEYDYKSRQYFTPDNSAVQSQGAYRLINASIGYAPNGGRWQAILFGRNLGDTQYVTTTASFPGPISGRVGEPRTYGVRLIYEY